MTWQGAWLHGVHRTRRDGSSFTWHQPCQCCKYTTSVDTQKQQQQNALLKKLVTHVESHASAVSLLQSGEWRYCKSDQQQQLLHLCQTTLITPGFCITTAHIAYVSTNKTNTVWISPWYNRTGWLGVKHQVTRFNRYGIKYLTPGRRRRFVFKCVLWRYVASTVLLVPRLQTLVYDILPSTTAVFSYAIGSRKLSANE